MTNGWVSNLDDVRSGLPLSEASDDPTKLFVNSGTGIFTDETRDSGINDFALGRAIIVFDYDHDGDEDIVITNNSGSPVFYRSDASINGNNWLRLKFVGTESNRDAFGTDVRVTTGDKTQRLHFNPTNAFMGQREAVLHVGLGTGVTAVDSIELTWPSGLVQTVTNLAANSVHYNGRTFCSDHNATAHRWQVRQRRDRTPHCGSHRQPRARLPLV